MEIDPRITQHRTHFYLKTLKEGKNDIERWIAVSFIIILEYYINIICDGLQILNDEFQVWRFNCFYVHSKKK